MLLRCFIRFEFLSCYFVISNGECIIFSSFPFSLLRDRENTVIHFTLFILTISNS